jgi:hypothetical protein
LNLSSPFPLAVLEGKPELQSDTVYAVKISTSQPFYWPEEIRKIIEVAGVNVREESYGN